MSKSRNNLIHLSTRGEGWSSLPGEIVEKNNFKKELDKFSVADIHSRPKKYKNDACCAMIYYSPAPFHGLNSLYLPLIFLLAQNKAAFADPGRSLRGC